MNDPRDPRLRELIDDAVADIEPHDRLHQIRTHPKVSTMSNRRPWLLTAGAAAVAAAAVVVAVAVVTQRDSDPDGSGPVASAGSPSQTVDSPSPSETSSAPSTDQVAVPVYYVGDTPMGDRLFREFRRVDAGTRLLAAAQLATDGPPQDPDYRTLWPSGAIAAVSFDGVGAAGSFSVELADSSLEQRPAGMSSAEAKLAVQGLVFTLQGTGKARAPLTAYFDGEVVPLLGIDTAKGMQHNPDLLSLVNITQPEEGQQVTGSTLKVEGVANSFEANVPWEIQDAGGKVALKGFVTAEGWMDKLYPWSDEIDISSLSPGTYTFIARTDDPSDGEGPGPFEDTRSFTVG